jgi:charged multivesicular body protein 4A/B
MSGWMMNMLGARTDTKQTATHAIVGLREQLAMLDKKEEHLSRLIVEQHNKAKKNAVTNKAGTSDDLRGHHRPGIWSG